MTKTLLSTLLAILSLAIAPHASAQWNKLTGPVDNSLPLAIEYNSILEYQGMIFLAENRVGIFRTDDYGLHWQKIYSATWGTFPIHITANGTLFTDDNGILRSYDYGNTWQRIDSEIDGPVYAFDSDQDGTIYCSVNSAGNCLYKSADGGNTWQPLLSGYGDYYEIHVTASGQVWFGKYNGLLRSDDQGETWQNIEISDPYSFLNVTSIDSDTLGSVYVSTREIYAFYRTDDNGETWTTLGLYGDGGTTDIMYSGINNQIVFLEYTLGTIRSYDQGATWQNIYNSEGGTYFRSYCAINSDTVIATGEHGFLFSTNNGLTWQYRNNGLLSGFVASLAVTYSSTNSSTVFAASASGLWASSDNGLTFTDIGQPLQSRIFYSVTSHPSGLYLLSRKGPPNHLYKISRSTDHGLTWQTIHENAQKPLFKINSNGHILMLLSGNLSRSADHGLTWEPLFTDTTAHDIRDFTISFADVIVLADHRTNAFLISFDEGNTFQPAAIPLTYHTADLLRPDFLGNIYILSPQTSLHKLTPDPINQTVQFSPVNSVTGFGPLRDLFFHPSGPIFLQSDTALFQSTDQAQTWTDFYSPTVQPSALFTQLAFDTTNSLIYGAHSFNGLWRFENYITQSAGSALTTQTIPHLHLYPNPTANQVTITISNPSPTSGDSHKIHIYDLSGTLIRTFTFAGNTATLPLRGLAPGIYLLRSETGHAARMVVN